MPAGRMFSTDSYGLEVLIGVPPQPLRRTIYSCGKSFIVEPVLKLFCSTRPLGILFVNGNSFLCLVQHGTITDEVAHLGCRRRAGTRKGGQSAERFQRQRKNDVKGWESQVVSTANTVFTKVEGVVICGNGPLFYRVRGEVKKVLTSIGMQHPPSSSTCRDLYHRFEPLLSKLCTSPIAEKLVNLASRGSPHVVYGFKELGKAIEEAALKVLVIGVEHVGKLDLNKAKQMGSTVLIVPYNTDLETIYGGAIAERWY